MPVSWADAEFTKLSFDESELIITFAIIEKWFWQI